MGGLLNIPSTIIQDVSNLVGSFTTSPTANSGATPEQLALNQYNANQRQLLDATRFANTGTEMSTMNTMQQGGAGLGQAMANATIVDQSAQAALAANSPLQQLSNQLTQQNYSNQQYQAGATSPQATGGDTFSNQTQGDTTGGVGSTGTGGIGSA